MLTQRPPQHVNRLREVSFLDDDIGPNGGKERIFLNKLSGPLDEIQQRAEGLRRQRECLAVASTAQHTPSGVELESLEFINDVRRNVVHGPARTDLRRIET